MQLNLNFGYKVNKLFSVLVCPVRCGDENMQRVTYAVLETYVSYSTRFTAPKLSEGISGIDSLLSVYV